MNNVSEATQVQSERLWRRFAKRLNKLGFLQHFILWLILFYIGAMAPFTPGFLEKGNLVNLLVTLAPLFLVALGQMFVLIVGGIDLSITGIIGLVSIVGASVMTSHQHWLASPLLAILVGLSSMLLLGCAAGSLNGFAVTVLGMPPFIVTLSGMMFFTGLAVWFTHSKNIGQLPNDFVSMMGSPGTGITLAILVGGLAHLVLTRSIYGRWFYAVGHNARASFISGVPVSLVKSTAYIISGLCGALASVVYTGQSETGSPMLGQHILLDVIGATILGGTSLFGGKGSVFGTLCGVCFLKLVDNSLNLLSLSIFAITMGKGGVILLAAFLDVVQHRLTSSSR